MKGRRLLIVGEGVVHYLTFAALPSPSSIKSSSPRPVVIEHEIVNLPSASTLAVIRKEMQLRSKPDLTLAMLADPVFQVLDPRVTAAAAGLVSAKTDSSSTSRGNDSSANLSRLRAAEQEAEAISAM